MNLGRGWLERELEELGKTAAGLQVWRFKGDKICKNNRRLYCLKQYQERREDGVMVKIRQYSTHRAFCRPC